MEENKRKVYHVDSYKFFVDTNGKLKGEYECVFDFLHDTVIIFGTMLPKPLVCKMHPEKCNNLFDYYCAQFLNHGIQFELDASKSKTISNLKNLIQNDPMYDETNKYLKEKNRSCIQEINNINHKNFTNGCDKETFEHRCYLILKHHNMLRYIECIDVVIDYPHEKKDIIRAFCELLINTPIINT